MPCRSLVLFGTLLCLLSALVKAIDAVDFDFPEQLERYQQLTFELRCPKCQNQNLIDSDSQISQDLRREVARLIKEGKSDDEIRRHMVSLYGDFILYRPPVQANTLVLWLAPFVMLAIGALIAVSVFYRRARINKEEDAKVARSSGNAQ